MQGAGDLTIYVDPSFDGAALALQLDAANATDTASLISTPATVLYPVPIAVGTIPALSGAVGDLVDLALAPYFSDGNPNSSANASLRFTAMGLPAGLSVSGNRIVGTYAAPVTGQAISISATNSGGTVAQATSATVSGGAFLYNNDFNLPGAVSSEWVASDPNLRLTVIPDDPAVGTYGSVGALLIEGLARRARSSMIAPAPRSRGARPAGPFFRGRKTPRKKPSQMPLNRWLRPITRSIQRLRNAANLPLSKMRSMCPPIPAR